MTQKSTQKHNTQVVAILRINTYLINTQDYWVMVFACSTSSSSPCEPKPHFNTTSYTLWPRSSAHEALRMRSEVQSGWIMHVRSEPHGSSVGLDNNTAKGCEEEPTAEKRKVITNPCKEGTTAGRAGWLAGRLFPHTHTQSSHAQEGRKAGQLPSLHGLISREAKLIP